MTQLDQEDYHLFHYSLYRRTSCQTLSNAFDKFKKALQISKDGLESNALIIL